MFQKIGRDFIRDDEKESKDWSNVITDDELQAVLIQKLPEECKLISVFDCCHSGSIMDLDYVWFPKVKEMKNLFNTQPVAADVISIAGCFDAQESAEGQNSKWQKEMRKSDVYDIDSHEIQFHKSEHNGKLTRNLITILEHAHHQQKDFTIAELWEELIKGLAGAKQVPVISVSQNLGGDRAFSLKGTAANHNSEIGFSFKRAHFEKGTQQEVAYCCMHPDGRVKKAFPAPCQPVPPKNHFGALAIDRYMDTEVRKKTNIARAIFIGVDHSESSSSCGFLCRTQARELMDLFKQNPVTPWETVLVPGGMETEQAGANRIKVELEKALKGIKAGDTIFIYISGTVKRDEIEEEVKQSVRKSLQQDWDHSQGKELSPEYFVAGDGKKMYDSSITSALGFFHVTNCGCLQKDAKRNVITLPQRVRITIVLDCGPLSGNLIDVRGKWDHGKGNWQKVGFVDLQADVILICPKDENTAQGVVTNQITELIKAHPEVLDPLAPITKTSLLLKKFPLCNPAPQKHIDTPTFGTWFTNCRQISIYSS